MPGHVRNPNELRTQTFAGVLDIKELTRKADKEFDEMAVNISDLLKKVYGSSAEGSGEADVDCPTAALLDDTDCSDPDHDPTYAHKAANNMTPAPSDFYWLRSNRPQHKQGSESIMPDTIIRVSHGAAGAYTATMLEQTVSIYLVLAVAKKVAETTSTYLDPIYCTFKQDVSEVDAALGYSDFDMSHNKIDVNDHVSPVLVMTMGSNSSVEVSYGLTDRGYTAGDGIPIPETITWKKIQLPAAEGALQKKYRGSFARDWKNEPPYTSACNFYEILEVWWADAESGWDLVSTHPNADGAEGWELILEKSMNRAIRRVKRITNKAGATADEILKAKKIKAKIPFDPAEKPFHCTARIVDHFGQEGYFPEEDPGGGGDDGDDDDDNTIGEVEVYWALNDDSGVLVPVYKFSLDGLWTLVSDGATAWESGGGCYPYSLQGAGTKLIAEANKVDSSLESLWTKTAGDGDWTQYIKTDRMAGFNAYADNSVGSLTDSIEFAGQENGWDESLVLVANGYLMDPENVAAACSASVDIISSTNIVGTKSPYTVGDRVSWVIEQENALRWRYPGENLLQNYGYFTNPCHFGVSKTGVVYGIVYRKQTAKFCLAKGDLTGERFSEGGALELPSTYTYDSRIYPSHASEHVVWLIKAGTVGSSPTVSALAISIDDGLTITAAGVPGSGTFTGFGTSVVDALTAFCSTLDGTDKEAFITEDSGANWTSLIDESPSECSKFTGLADTTTRIFIGSHVSGIVSMIVINKTSGALWELLKYTGFANVTNEVHTSGTVAAMDCYITTGDRGTGLAWTADNGETLQFSEVGGGVNGDDPTLCTQKAKRMALLGSTVGTCSKIPVYFVVSKAGRIMLVRTRDEGASWQIRSYLTSSPATGHVASLALVTHEANADTGDYVVMSCPDNASGKARLTKNMGDSWADWGTWTSLYKKVQIDSQNDMAVTLHDGTLYKAALDSTDHITPGTWTAIANTAAGAGSVTSFCLDWRDNKIIYALCNDQKVYQATDFANATWDAGVATGYAASQERDIVAVDTVLYVVGKAASTNSYTSIYKSTISADTRAGTAALSFSACTRIAAAGSVEITMNGLCVDPYNDLRLIVASHTTTTGIYTSLDGGTTWVVGTAGNFWCIAPVPHVADDPNYKFLVGGYEGAVKVIWNGATFQCGPAVPILGDAEYICAAASRQMVFPT